MFKKNGFTLAEVLVSFAVIGVVAAITLPSLLLNVEKRKAGPALMKAINTIETSSTLALQVQGARKLSDIKKNGQGNLNLIEGILVDYTKLTEAPFSTTVGNTPSGTPYSTKDGIVIFDAGVDGDVYTITVDTNGQRSPNKAGRDQFELNVMMDGIVAPKGSYLYVEKFGGNRWDTSCPSMTKTDKGTISDAASCAGAIVDNGGRVLYNYESID